MLTKTVVTKKQLYMQACNKNRQNLYTKTVVTKKQVSKHASKKPPKLAHQTGMPYPCFGIFWKMRGINKAAELALDIKEMLLY